MARKQQNDTEAEWNITRRTFHELDEVLVLAIARDTFSSGVQLQQKLNGDIRKGPVDPMFGADTPPPYGDSTGELAISKEQSDAVHAYVQIISDNVFKASEALRHALNSAKTILAVTPADVTERAYQSIPDCTACGDPILGKIFYGRWDDKCRTRFRRWVEAGNPPDEKLKFEMMVRNAKD